MPGLSDLEQDGMKITYLASYASLAKFVSSDPDHSTAIFKTFDRLAARNLLYLQSELAELQAQQDRYDDDDLRPEPFHTTGISFAKAAEIGMLWLTTPKMMEGFGPVCSSHMKSGRR